MTPKETLQDLIDKVEAGPEHLHDPGGKVRTRLPRGMFGWAEFSACGRYRHLLGRYWGSAPIDSFDYMTNPYALWIGKNPSTAAARVNDPTITREIDFTRRLGFDCLVKANVMDFRATNPKDLTPELACSAGNLATIVDYAKSAEVVIAAWGTMPDRFMWSVKAVADVLLAANVPLTCLGLTKAGFPRHPLYVRKDAPLQSFPGRAHLATMEGEDVKTK